VSEINTESEDYLAGYREGEDTGYEAGLNDAECEGDCGAYDQGYNHGHEDGLEQGLDNGQEDAYNEGFAAGKKFAANQFLSPAEDLMRQVDFGQHIPWALDGVDKDAAYLVSKELQRIAQIILD
jgi:flagellar biosynthesis/type III secretory pathway protein FliH